MAARPALSVTPPSDRDVSPPPPPRPPRPTPPIATSEPPEPPARSFDWENLVGVKLFSGIAGIALVLAAVFFLKYSIDRGWLSPPVRVAIGIIVADRAAGHLRAEGRAAICGDGERARRRGDRDPVRHLLRRARVVAPDSRPRSPSGCWRSSPSLAVLLSIRRDSLFIAVLGLLGGFATPALLSTGENRPIPLFVYLLLLNVGLAWVASRKKWPGLTVLTLVLTAVYQWGWVFKFLSGQPIVAGDGHLPRLRDRVVRGADVRRATTTRRWTSRSSGRASARRPCRCVFAIFLAAVPAYGAHAGAAVRIPAAARRGHAGGCRCGRREDVTGCTPPAPARRCSCSPSGWRRRTRAAPGSRVIAVRRGLFGAFYRAGAAGRCRGSTGRSRARRREGGLCRAAAPVRVPGHRAHRAGGGRRRSSFRHDVRRCWR